MFRNGINVGRRPLGQLAHAKHELPFVCNACQQHQARTMASKHFHKPEARKPGARNKKTTNFEHRKRRQQSMLEQVKQLEAHVQMMERSYAEQLRKRAAEKVWVTTVRCFMYGLSLSGGHTKKKKLKLWLTGCRQFRKAMSRMKKKIWRTRR
jgi:hypothetical protein